jgi:ankyrin repeat protein
MYSERPASSSSSYQYPQRGGQGNQNSSQQGYEAPSESSNYRARPVAMHEEGTPPNRFLYQQDPVPVAPERRNLSPKESLLEFIRAKNVAALKQLLSNGTLTTDDINAPDPANGRKTLLHVAVEGRNADIVKTLVEAGSLVNSHEDSDGMTPLVRAMDCCASVVEFMMRKGQGSKLTESDTYGRNLIHRLAAGQSTSRTFPRLRLMQFLAEEHGVDPTAPDEAGNRPADYARKNFVKLGSDEQAREIVDWLEAPSNHKLTFMAFQQQARQEGPRFVFCHPYLRILCILLLFTLHCLSYAVDTSSRNSTTLARFKFVFEVLNLVGASWPTTNSTLLAVKLLCILVGFLVGLIVAILFQWLIARKLFRWRIFAGPGSIVSDEDTTQWRGLWFLMFYFAWIGIYGGGLVFNAWLPRFRDSEAFARMGEDAGLSLMTTSKIFLGISLVIDIFLFLFVIDTMISMAAERSPHTPFHSYNSFCDCLHPGWYMGRFPFFWCFFVAGTFVIIYALAADIIDYPNATLPASAPQKIATSGCTIFITVVVMMQDWILPYMYAIPETAKLPGLPFGSNSSWLLWWLCSILLTLDGYMTYSLVEEWVLRESFTDTIPRVELAFSLLPVFVSVSILLCFLIFNMDRCCFAEKTSSSVQPIDQRGSPREPGFSNTDGPGNASGRQGQGPSGSNPLKKTTVVPSIVLSPGKSYAAESGLHAQGPNAPLKADRLSNRRSDIWTAAFNDDVIRLCTLLDADPSLVNARGGIGLVCSRKEGRVYLCTTLDPSCSACPLHYAIAGNAASAVATLLSKGANPKIRTSNGMWTAREVSEVVGNEALLDSL